VPGFPVLERITGGVDPAQPLPLVLVLHGIGGSEEQLVPYTNLKVRRAGVRPRPVPNGTARTPAIASSERAMPRRLHDRGRRDGPQIVRVADTIASQRAVTRTLVLGYSQGGHIAWLLAATGRFDVVFRCPAPSRRATCRRLPRASPRSGRCMARTIEPSSDRGRGDLSGLLDRRLQGRLLAGESGSLADDARKHIAPLLTAALSPQATRPISPGTLRAR